MLRKSLFLLSLFVWVSLAASGQELTAREYAKAHSIPNRQSGISLTPPHACTLSKQHPCVYYGGDIDPNDPEENGLSNENDLFIPDDFTYDEINAPASMKISAAFSNNLQTFGVIDPQTATWHFRVGVSEGNGGTLIAYGVSPAQLTQTGRIAFGFDEYELLTRTPVTLPSGNVWFSVTPNCTNPNDPECNQDDPRYFESDTDGLNGINNKFTVTSKDGFGPFLEADNYFGGIYNWCNDEGVACGDGTSEGLLK